MMTDRDKVIAWLADTELYYMETGKTENELYQSEMAHNALALLKEQENASKRNPVIVCPHCGKRVK